LYHRTGGIALAAKISEKIGFNFSDNKSSSQLAHPEILKVMYLHLIILKATKKV
jgi:hypothetical protein